MKTKKWLSVLLSLLLMVSIASPAVLTVQAASNEQTIFNFLTNDMGLNTAAACGVLANIEKESNFRNDVLEYGYTWASGGGYGICQWTNSPRTASTGRRTNLVNWCNNNGYDYTSLNGQLHYLQYELNTSYYYNIVTKRLKNASNDANGAYTAGYYWCYYFEVPAGYNTGVSETRGNLAKNTYWPKYSGITPDPLVKDSRYPMPFKCRIISTTKVQCYNDAAKTSSPGYIYPEDDCVITAIYTNGLLKCDCPWSDGSTKTVYIDKTAFINSSMTPASMTAPQYGVTYLRSDGGTSIGWIDPGDSITKVATSGSYTQIIYPASSGKRCAWVLTGVLSAPETINYPTPFVCRIISTVKVPCYNDVNFSSSPGNIYPDDDCEITALYSNGKLQCRCPWSDGSTKTVYVNSSEFFPSTPTPIRMTAPKYAKTYLRTSNTEDYWGWIDGGDAIYKLGSSGSMTQILYPKSDGQYRCAWVYTSDLTETYTVSYNANGGTGAPGNQTKTYNVSLTLSSTVPTRAGYTFLGWSTNASATSATYAAGGVYTNNAAVALYAIWKPNQYNISYDANGGTGVPSPQTKIHGTTLILSSTIPERYGYSFLGWSIDQSATTATYSAGGKFDYNGSVMLYAVWSANSYTITYDANGGTGMMESGLFVYDQSAALRTNAFVREGYSFLGWSINPTDEEIMYADNDVIANLSGTKNDTVTLYAIWEENAPEYTPGDINGDGIVNNKDLTRLMKYLAGENVTVVEAALDINGDGVVNNKDLTRLMKYLAGEGVNIY